MHKYIYHPVVWYTCKCKSLRMWFVITYYHKIFSFAVLERWLIYDCEIVYSFVYLIFAVLLHKLTTERRSVLDLYAFMNAFEVSSFNRFRDMEGPKILKVGKNNVTTSPLLWPNFAYFSLVPCISNLRFLTFRDMEGVPKFKK